VSEVTGVDLWEVRKLDGLIDLLAVIGDLFDQVKMVSLQ